ncbi:hypothetical protein OROHE_009383 [Orobanche hederae]
MQLNEEQEMDRKTPFEIRTGRLRSPIPLQFDTKTVRIHEGRTSAKEQPTAFVGRPQKSPGSTLRNNPQKTLETVNRFHSQISRRFTRILKVFNSRYTFNVALLSIFGKDEVLYREDLKRCYYNLEKGYNSMAINIPGTLFHKAMKARKELARIVAKILSLRRERKQHHTDLLGSFMGDSDGLSDEQIADNIIGVIFAARDTTASVLTWIIKYLAENPNVLQAVTEEQQALINLKEDCGEKKGLNWVDTKKMLITKRVIQETLRAASILSFTFREAVEDVEFNGYLIPKGWKVLPLFRNIHHNPDNFPEPEKIDPSRFEVAPKPNTFIPFGNGTHSCPGNELAKLEILVLIHHLTTKYKWSIIGSQDGIQYGPFALPQNGLPIKLSLKS